MTTQKVNYFTDVIIPILEKEVQETVESIIKSDEYTNTIAEVKESAKFKKQVEDFMTNLAIEITKQKLGIYNTWSINDRIANEVRARLSVMKIDTFENVANTVINSVNVEDYINNK
jgi:hypothetical protein